MQYNLDFLAKKGTNGKTPLEQYNDILTLLEKKQSAQNEDLKQSAQNEDFRKAFNAFFITAPVKNEWRARFYELFEEVRNDPKKQSFDYVIDELYRKNGKKRVDGSFCSKMLAVLDPQKPIIDQYVLWQMGYNVKAVENKKGDEKLEFYKRAYKEIQEQYQRALKLATVQEAINAFDQRFSDYKEMSNVKKLDFLLWSNRNDRIPSVFEYEALKG